MASGVGRIAPEEVRIPDEGTPWSGMGDTGILLRGDPAEESRHAIYRRVQYALVGLTAIYEGRACLGAYGAVYLGLPPHKRSPRYRSRK